MEAVDPDQVLALRPPSLLEVLDDRQVRASKGACIRPFVQPPTVRVPDWYWYATRVGNPVANIRTRAGHVSIGPLNPHPFFSPRSSSPPHRRETREGPRISVTHLMYVAVFEDQQAALQFHRDVREMWLREYKGFHADDSSCINE